MGKGTPTRPIISFVSCCRRVIASLHSFLIYSILFINLMITARFAGDFHHIRIHQLHIQHLVAFKITQCFVRLRELVRQTSLKHSPSPAIGQQGFVDGFIFSSAVQLVRPLHFPQWHQQCSSRYNLRDKRMGGVERRTNTVGNVFSRRRNKL